MSRLPVITMQSCDKTNQMSRPAPNQWLQSMTPFVVALFLLPARAPPLPVKDAHTVSAGLISTATQPWSVCCNLCTSHPPPQAHRPSMLGQHTERPASNVTH